MAFIPITIGNVTIGKGLPLVVISGPCVIESKEHALMCAETLQHIFDRKGVQLIYKSSYDKANRSSIESFRGLGIEKGLEVLQEVKERYGVPVLTDIHHPDEASLVAKVCDVIQIPAFLCRQTDLLIAAGETQLPINIKKGQFLAPWDMRYAVEKVASTGNQKMILTDRGTSFGYNNLVSDFRSIPLMQKLSYPVCFDASHSVQLPGGKGSSSGGQREFIPTLARAALGAGADLLFIESHPRPSKAKSDAASVMEFGALEKLLDTLIPLFHLMQEI